MKLRYSNRGRATTGGAAVRLTLRVRSRSAPYAIFSDYQKHSGFLKKIRIWARAVLLAPGPIVDGRAVR